MRIAVYGTLRKGLYNYKRFDEYFTYLGTTTIKGYKLYQYSFPIILPSDDGEVVVDLIEVSSQSVLSTIDRMEIGAGYKTEDILIDGELYRLYPYARRPIRNLIEIPSGDYKDYEINNS